MWSLWTLLTQWEIGIEWQPELWSGLIVMNGVLAFALAASALAPVPSDEPAG